MKVKNVFNGFPFKKIGLSNPPIYKTDSTASFFFDFLKNFKIGGRASVAESLFRKVKETSAFNNSVEKSNTCMVCFETLLWKF